MSKTRGNILDGDRQDVRGARAAFGLSAAITKLRADGGQRERSAGRMHDRVAIARAGRTGVYYCRVSVSVYWRGGSTVREERTEKV